MSREHQPGGARQRAQHLEAGAHRARIGVVGIVDDPAVAQPRLELQPAGHRAEFRRDPRRCRRATRPAAARRGRRAESVRDIVRAAGLAARSARSPSGHSSVKRVANSPRSIAWTGFFAREVRAACTPKVTMRDRARDAAPVARIGVVGIDDRGGVGVEARRPFLPRRARRRRDRRSPRDARRRRW